MVGGLIAILAVPGFILFLVMVDKSMKKKQEQQEKEKNLQREKEREKEKEQRENELARFKGVLEGNLDYIFEVIEDKPTTDNFEKGLEKAIKDSGMAITVEDILPTAQEVLLSRMTKNSDDTISSCLFASYFGNAMDSILLSNYLPVAVLEESMKREQYDFLTNSLNEKRIPFLKVLYGFSVRAWNYYNGLKKQSDYTPVDNTLLRNIVTTSQVIQSYCKSNPFEAEEKQMEWVKDIRNAAYEITSHLHVKFDFKNNEKLLEELCYWGYVSLCGKDEVDAEHMADNLLKVTMRHYERIRSRT